MTRSEIVGKNISILRTTRGMNQTDLANAIGRTQSMVALYETGKRLPSTQIMGKIAEVFGVPFDEIYYSKDERTNDEEYDWYEEAFSEDNNFPQTKYDPETIKKLKEIGDGLTAITKTKKWKQLSGALQSMSKSDFDRTFNMIHAVYPEYFKKDDK